MARNSFIVVADTMHCKYYQPEKPSGITNHFDNIFPSVTLNFDVSP